MSAVKQTLTELLRIPGPSGFEGACAAYIQEKIAPYVDEIKSDALGNLICVKKGKGKRVMLAAHSDEIGLIVTGIEGSGFLRVAPIGGLHFELLPGRHVRLKSGCAGVVFSEGGHADGKVSAQRLFIDIGASTKAEAEKKANVGDWAVIEAQISELGARLSAPYMDDRAGCAVLIETMKALGAIDAEVYAVFTSQEEVGLRGAGPAAYALEPDLGIAVDVTIADDVPRAKEGVCVSRLGGGAAIKVMDRGIIAHPQVKRLMEEAADEAGVPYQLEVLTAGATDAGAIHTSRGGVPSGTLSIPCRYVHSPAETIDLNDLEGAVKLLTALLRKA
ncbi:MAG: M42 family metallopeptidase [Christensenellaceae bacterium]|jgi:endoglucanase|nr:M42 family metallopeptidase [Christensenellaceae bacterium]